MQDGCRVVSPSCFRVLESRPITVDDVFRLVTSGHLNYAKDYTLKPFA